MVSATQVAFLVLMGVTGIGIYRFLREEGGVANSLGVVVGTFVYLWLLLALKKPRQETFLDYMLDRLEMLSLALFIGVMIGAFVWKFKMDAKKF